MHVIPTIQIDTQGTFIGLCLIGWISYIANINKKEELTEVYVVQTF